MIPDLASSNTALLQGSEYLKITNQDWRKTKVMELTFYPVVFSLVMSEPAPIFVGLKISPVEFKCFNRILGVRPGQARR